MGFTFVYDPSELDAVRAELDALPEGFVAEKVPFNDSDEAGFTSNDRPLLCYLSDAQIRKVLKGLAGTNRLISILPHPDAKRACKFFGVDLRLDKALRHVQTEPAAVQKDLMLCDDAPVLSSVVVGDTFSWATSNFFGSMNVLKRLLGLFRLIFRMKPFQVEIAKQDEHELKTAALGVFITTHNSDSAFSRFIPGESSYNDGMLHALPISPRSITELLTYTFRSLFRPNELPTFGGHIRTSRLTLSSSSGELKYSVDGKRQSSNRIDFQVLHKALTIVPGALLEIEASGSSSKDVFRVHALPGGEAAREMTGRRIPILRRASTEEFKELFHVLRDNARLKNSFIVLMILSTGLATLGLFANSSPVVIGAMILAPLMSPIISLSMASLRQERRLVIESAFTILVGLGVSVLFAIGITLLTPIHTANSEILSRTNPNLVDLGIAVISGVAGAYAHAREEVAKTLAGVAIAVALVPPLAVAGIGIGWLNWQVFYGASLLLLTNLAGMVLAAALTFLVLGFSPFRLASKGMLVWLMVVAVFSVPLAFGFEKMVYEHRVVNALDGWETNGIHVTDVRVKRHRPLKLSLILVTKDPLTDQEIKQVKTEIEERLNTTVELEVSIALRR